jgi:signal transduction histidine kinase
MDSSDAKPGKERAETDASLLAERAKTDAELAKKRSSVEADEDHVVEVARERAEEPLDAARERADGDMATAGATPELREKIEAERATADGAVAAERAVADERLRVERDAHGRALFALLRLERDATDDGLLVERTRADEVIATRDDFLGVVSHDMRNILGSIAMSAAALAKRSTVEGNGDAQTMGLTERIQRGTARLNRLVGDLLDVVSLEAGKLRITPQSQDAVQLVKDAVEAFEPSFAAKGVALATDVAAGSIAARFDHDRILQVLANLLSNALKFTARGGHVALSLARTGSEVRFSVTDTGVGIPAGREGAIFERFGQVARDGRGHGLGLYIAKNIVDAHSGRIWVEKPDAGGAALHFTLPRAEL